VRGFGGLESTRQMGVVETIHGGYVHGRRVRALSEHLARVLPEGAKVLDVGCGDGLVARAVLERRRDLEILGIDVLVREGAHIAVEQFDGRKMPAENDSYDVVMFVDVLHHTDDPMVLLREAKRVARRAVVIKDHTRDGFLAGTTLRVMDRVGNARHGVRLPYNYWTRSRWEVAFEELGLKVAVWERDLGIYPAWADWVFGRGLHFVARLERAAEQ